MDTIIRQIRANVHFLSRTLQTADLKIVKCTSIFLKFTVLCVFQAVSCLLVVVIWLRITSQKMRV